MCSVMHQFIYYSVDPFCIGSLYVMLTYYVTLFVSLLFNYMTRHLFCLCDIYVTIYVTSTMTSLSGCRWPLNVYRWMLKGNLVHVAPACAGSREGSDHFGSIVRSLSLHFCKRLFPGLEPVTSWSQGSSFYHCAKAPLPTSSLPLTVQKLYRIARTSNR